MATSETRTDRQGLLPCPVAEVLTALTARRGSITLTISVGQPLSVLHRALYDQGGYLLELDDDEQPVAAYRDPAAVTEE